MIRMGRRYRQRGVTLVELVCVTAVTLVLAGMAMPVASKMVKRQKELELRRSLREIRTAIDRFQMDTERFPGMRGPSGVINATNEEGYPEKMDHLYQGVDVGLPNGVKIKYLRRLPTDPITGKKEWGTRSSRDEPEAMFSDGINIFDVRSKSQAVALDGTKYATW
jgi:general secretion pathway protein G